jgi:hypothetical protein
MDWDMLTARPTTNHINQEPFQESRMDVDTQTARPFPTPLSPTPVPKPSPLSETSFVPPDVHGGSTTSVALDPAPLLPQPSTVHLLTVDAEARAIAMAVPITAPFSEQSPTPFITRACASGKPSNTPSPAALGKTLPGCICAVPVSTTAHTALIAATVSIQPPDPTITPSPIAPTLSTGPAPLIVPSVPPTTLTSLTGARKRHVETTTPIAPVTAQPSIQSVRAFGLPARPHSGPIIPVAIPIPSIAPPATALALSIDSAGECGAPAPSVASIPALTSLAPSAIPMSSPGTGDRSAALAAALHETFSARSPVAPVCYTGTSKRPTEIPVPPTLPSPIGPVPFDGTGGRTATSAALPLHAPSFVAPVTVQIAGSSFGPQISPDNFTFTTLSLDLFDKPVARNFIPPTVPASRNAAVGRFCGRNLPTLNPQLTPVQPILPTTTPMQTYETGGIQPQQWPSNPRRHPPPLVNLIEEGGKPFALFSAV